LIFRSGTGIPLRQRTVKSEFRRLLEAAGIRPIRLYGLRHTAATLAVAAGVSVKVISDQLGHANRQSKDGECPPSPDGLYQLNKMTLPVVVPTNVQSFVCS